MSDDDDVTVTNGSRSEQHGPPEDEILVRFQVTTSSNAMRAKQMVIEVLLNILQAFPNDIVWIDNKREELVYNKTMQADKVFNQLKNASMTAHEVRTKHSIDSKLLIF